jgi:hypothetical protein
MNLKTLFLAQGLDHRFIRGQVVNLAKRDSPITELHHGGRARLLGGQACRDLVQVNVILA